jgi:hypothetical protein
VRCSYFEEVESYFHALMLLFLVGMVGFVLTGDLFNAFAFELMGAHRVDLGADRGFHRGARRRVSAGSADRRDHGV